MTTLNIGPVFVPFQVFEDGKLKKRDDIPRFLTSSECMVYLRVNLKHVLNKERIQFIEHDESWARQEYLEKVGWAPL